MTTYQQQQQPLMVTVPVTQLTPTVAPPAPPRNPIATRRLAIVQLVIGILTIGLGIAGVVHLAQWHTFATYTGAGIWSGGWILLTGLVGMCRTRNWQSTCLNCLYMTFCIISSLVGFAVGWSAIVTVQIYIPERSSIRCNEYEIDFDYLGNDCRNRSVGLGIYISFVILMGLEFFAAIISAVLCCQNCCCKSSAHQGQVILQPTAGQVMVMQPGNTIATQGSKPYPAQQPGYAPQPGYASQAAHAPAQPGYPPSQIGYAPQVGYGSHQAYPPQQYPGQAIPLPQQSQYAVQPSAPGYSSQAPGYAQPEGAPFEEKPPAYEP